MSNVKILIIEDNPMNLELASDLLELAGFEVLTAITAANGLDVARLEHPQLVLLDLDLPDMSGLEAAAQLRADPTTAGITIVAFTAYAMSNDRETAVAAGCSGYLTKPINTRTFAAQVRELLTSSPGES